MMLKSPLPFLLLSTTLPLASHAELTWERTSAEVETSFGQASIEASYPFKNTGTYPVKILEVDTSCGCTYAAASKEVVAPGESAEVMAFFETETREGPQGTTITVRTDDPAQSRTVLKLQTDIPPAAILPQRTVIWKPGQPLEVRQMDITTELGVTLKLGKPKRLLPVKAALEPLEYGPGYRLTITPDEGAEEASGLLPIEATWGEGNTRTYGLYLRIGKR